jgi:hypothetical protein
MVLGAITGVPTPACLSAASNPVEAVTPPCGSWQKRCIGHSKNYFQYNSLALAAGGTVKFEITVTDTKTLSRIRPHQENTR